MVDEVAHEWEYTSVISGRREHELSVAERVLNSLRHVAACKVVDRDFCAAVGSELLGKILDSLFRVAVYRSVCDADSLALNAVG